MAGLMAGAARWISRRWACQCRLFHDRMKTMIRCMPAVVWITGAVWLWSYSI